MGRVPTPDAVIRDVESRIKSGSTIIDGCRQVGIAPSTFYAHRSRGATPHFPTIKRSHGSWQLLKRSYRPKGFRIGSDRRLQELAEDVTEAFQKVFERPGKLRTRTQQAVALERLISPCAKLIDTFNQLDANGDADVLNLVADHDELGHEFRQVLSELHGHLPHLEQLASDLRASHGQQLHDHGGRRTDPRIGAATVRLADIFARFRKRVPLHTTDPLTGKSRSAFNKFVRHAFDHFLAADYRFPPHALRSAMQHAAARIDWTDTTKNRD